MRRLVASSLVLALIASTAEAGRGGFGGISMGGGEGGGGRHASMGSSFAVGGGRSTRSFNSPGRSFPKMNQRSCQRRISRQLNRSYSRSWSR